MSTEVTNDLRAVDMVNFLTVVVRAGFKQALIYVFCRADLIIIYMKERGEKEKDSGEVPFISLKH